MYTLHPMMTAVAGTLLCAGLTVAQAQAQTQPQPAAKSTRPAAKPKAKPAPKAPVEVPLAVASAEQLAAADRALYGDYACEFNQVVNVGRSTKAAGYVDVAWNKERYTMMPVVSSTGAIRLEDVKGRTLMIQIAMKSMLLDAKIGQRLVDECVHADQLAARQAATASPPQGTIGIDPSIAAPDAAAQPSAPAAPTK
jgi:hypothetical protein